MAELLASAARLPIRIVLDESPYKFKCRDFAEIIGKLAGGNIRHGISGMGGGGRAGALDSVAGGAGMAGFSGEKTTGTHLSEKPTWT